MDPVMTDDHPKPGIPAARRQGRRLTRWRRTATASTSVLAVAAVAVLTVGTGAARSAAAPAGAGAAAAGPAVLRHFNPLVPYISFGWLPAGQKLVAGDNRPGLQALIAGRHSWTDRSVWDLAVYAAGQCRLGGQVTELTCSTPALEGLTATITRSAPAIRGHRAFWAGPDLIWQYARGGWAALTLPWPADFPRLATPAQIRKARHQARRIAAHVRYGAATPPLLFPVQLRNLPRKWRVGSVFYLPQGRVFRAERFALTAGTPNLGADGGLEYQRNLPYFSTIDPAAATHRRFCYRSPGSVARTINGHRVILSHWSAGALTRHDLCAAHATGLDLYISEFGAHPPVSLAGLFRDHLRLLGTRPAHWTAVPVT
jgi:hypothetical protein